jgi:hypothetical protein
VDCLPESVAFLQLAELHGDDASECGTYETSVQSCFAQSAREEVDIVDVIVRLSQTCNDLRRDLS